MTQICDSLVYPYNAKVLKTTLNGVYHCPDVSSLLGLWGRLECGEFTADQYRRLFHKEMKEKLHVDLPDGIISRMNESHAEVKPHPEMMDAVRCIRAEGIKTALLTNNYFMEEGKSYQPLDAKEFDLVGSESFVRNFGKVLRPSVSDQFSVSTRIRPISVL